MTSPKMSNASVFEKLVVVSGWLALRLAAIACGEPGRQRVAARGRDALQQRAGEGRVAEHRERRRVARRPAGDQAAAVQRAGDAGEQHPLVELGRGALRALLAEIGDSDEGGDRAVIVVGRAAIPG